MEHALVESFNGCLRDECLNVYQLEAQAITQAWWVDYNTRCPHSSLGHLTPSEFVSQRQEDWEAKAASSPVKSCLETGATSLPEDFPSDLSQFS